jgi:hypothetical protein
MDRFWSDIDNLSRRDVEDMRYYVDSYTMYLILESFDSTVPEFDPIYGEDYEVFDNQVVEATSGYLPFTGSVISRIEDSELYGQGFRVQKRLSVDAPLCVQWSAGMQVLFEGVVYRIKSTDKRGLNSPDRVILHMDEVT